MSDISHPRLQKAAAVFLAEKRAKLLADREELSRLRVQLVARMRENHRELADCRAAARLLGVDFEIPVDDQEDIERLYLSRIDRELELRSRDRSVRTHEVRAHEVRVPSITSENKFGSPTVIVQRDVPVVETVVANGGVSKLPVRELVLDLLRSAGVKGAKAAALREKVEALRGEPLHEKTVGMTLFRLSKDGLVRREGHIWFFVDQPSAETKNPGGSTPGSISSASK